MCLELIDTSAEKGSIPKGWTEGTVIRAWSAAAFCSSGGNVSGVIGVSRQAGGHTPVPKTP